MKKIIFILIFGLSAFFFIYNYNQRYLPGYDFILFKNTKAEKLAYAVEDENIKNIDDILKNDPLLVDFQEKKFNNSLLMLSIVNKKYNSLNALLKNGANPNLKDYQNETPLMLSCGYIGNPECKVEIVDSLLNYGGLINLPHKFKGVDDSGNNIIIDENLLLIAVNNGCLNLVKFLTEKGANINYNYNNNSAIYYAFIYEYLDIAKYLIIEKKALIPTVFNVGYYNGKIDQKINIFEFLEQHKFNSPYHSKEIIDEIKQYLIEHPEQIITPAPLHLSDSVNGEDKG